MKHLSSIVLNCGLNSLVGGVRLNKKNSNLRLQSRTDTVMYGTFIVRFEVLRILDSLSASSMLINSISSPLDTTVQAFDIF